MLAKEKQSWVVDLQFHHGKSALFEVFGIEEERGNELVGFAEVYFKAERVSEGIESLWKREFLTLKEKIFITFLLGRFVGRSDKAD